MFIYKCMYVIQILVSLACLLKSLQHIDVQKYPVDVDVKYNVRYLCAFDCIPSTHQDLIGCQLSLKNLITELQLFIYLKVTSTFLYLDPVPSFLELRL